MPDRFDLRWRSKTFALLDSSADTPLELFLRNLISGLILYGGLLIFYFQNKWYVDFLDDRTRLVLSGLLLVWFLWTAVGAAFWIFARQENFRSLPLLFFDAFASLINAQKLTHGEKTSLLKIAVKGFFFPLMLHWLLGNFDNMASVLKSHGFSFLGLIAGDLKQLGVFFDLNFNEWFRFVFDAFIFVDVLIFCFAYAVEAEWLGNKIKSVEPTLLGWIVALICYPPINNLTATYVTWHAHEKNFSLGPVWFDHSLHVLVLLLFAWYLWASISLGFKAGNLVNRGIVGHGAYRWSRHPAYFAKTTAWWIAATPVIWGALIALLYQPSFEALFWFLSVALSLGAWTLIYGLRAWTEERHLSQDPAYLAYKKKVPYVAIPGLI